MDFHTTAQSPKSKLPSLAFAVGAHAIMLWIAMQAVQVIHRDEKRIIDVIDPPKLTEPPKPIDIEVDHSKVLPPPSQSFFPPPEVEVERATFETSVTGTQVVPENKGFTKTEPGSDPNTTTITKEHAPVHVAAVVDAKACDKPEYPPRSLALGEEGVVFLAMLIGPNGQVLESRIEKSSGSKALDKAAVNGLALCKFKPGTVDGVPEKSWAKLQYAWTIN
ncbi:energy transducer TonB [Undibacterium cyanobacteriorum]|uniref:Energy transducer TonB n=1 Tax=Undibacterium cyanobacteriorum TaxID=3073561 RepID=A0ABY9RMF5_9BURK|nr:energy transducer TonB [Undibacterium sp. 20NA77.5]WMW81870.1 energy transducer TonB [Undibacterium sp. 20NA77.5]